MSTKDFRVSLALIILCFLILQICSGCASSSGSKPASSGGDSGTGTVTLSVSPASAGVQAPSGTQQFNATVTPQTQSVTWALSGSGCNGASCGTLSATSGASVAYTAPGSVPNPATVTLTASAGPITAQATITVTSSGGGGVTLSVSPMSANVQVPSGMQPFSATVTPQTQTVTWALSGAGCTGAACGTLSATSGASVVYTAPANLPNPATVALTASAGTTTAQSIITLAASGGGGGSGNIAVAISPKRAGLVISQLLAVTATLQNDSSNKGVTWSCSGGSSCGTFANVTATSASYVAPSTAGLYSIVATSVADSTKSASAPVGVTDLSGVLTHHNDLSRDGANTREFALTTANVNTTTFGKLFSCQADGAIYTQPLWIPNLTVGGAPHNLVVVATQHDGLFAFDADASPCVTLWHVNLIDSAHGGTADETTVPSGAGGLVGGGGGDITPEVGVTGTPVIDPTTNTLYVVSKSVNASTQFFQRIHSIDLTTGNERATPHSIDSSITLPGSAGDAVNGQIAFNSRTENQRPGLALYNGIVYVSWASHEDTDPYHGWIIGFSASTLAVAAVFNATPNTVGSLTYGRGGIWMSGGAPAVDGNGFLYCITGNGTFDAINGGSNYGDTMLKLNTASSLSVADYFTPQNQATLDADDSDFGGGAATILVDQPSSPTPHLIVGGGKDGSLFVINRDNMGKYNSGGNSVVQTIPVGGPIFATAAFWQNNLYISSATPLQQFVLNNTSGQLSAANQSGNRFLFPGPSPSVSANGASNGIVWALDDSAYCTPQTKNGCGPAVLHAYDASNVATELWNSTQRSGDQAGNAVKFTVPTVANGKVYVGTRGNNTGGSSSSTSTPGELDVYGLLTN